MNMAQQIIDEIVREEKEQEDKNFKLIIDKVWMKE